MATRDQIKAYFQTGDVPTQAQYEEFFDSIPFLEDADNTLSGESFQLANGTGGFWTSRLRADEVGKFSGFDAGTENTSVYLTAYDIGGDTSDTIVLDAGATNGFLLRANNEEKLKVTSANVSILGLGDYANDGAAATGGVPVGGLYHSSGAIKIRLV